MPNSTNSSQTTTACLSLATDHPLFLNPADHPGLVLISKRLIGTENYSSWSRSMRIALNSRSKFVIVNGVFKEPATDSELHSVWERVNDVVISWILNTVSEEIGNGLYYVTTAFALWNELRERFSAIDGHRLYMIEKQIHSLSQQDTSVEVYFGRLKSFWDENNVLETNTSCVCPCNCQFGRDQSGKDLRKNLLVFLIGLNECYANVKSQILLMNPLPSIGQAYLMVKQEEKNREFPKTGIDSIALYSNAGSDMPHATAQAFSQNYKRYNSAAQKNDGVRPVFKKGIFCAYCKKEGHEKSDCYKLVGFPSWHPAYKGNGNLNNRSYYNSAKGGSDMNGNSSKVLNMNGDIVFGSGNDDAGFGFGRQDLSIEQNGDRITKESFAQLQARVAEMAKMLRAQGSSGDHLVATHFTGPDHEEGTGLWKAA